MEFGQQSYVLHLVIAIETLISIEIPPRPVYLPFSVLEMFLLLPLSPLVDRSPHDDCKQCL